MKRLLEGEWFEDEDKDTDMDKPSLLSTQDHTMKVLSSNSNRGSECQKNKQEVEPVGPILPLI